MKNFIETIKYIGKNLIFVMGFAILPACFVGGLLQPFYITNFLVDYKNLKIESFLDILKPLFGASWVDVLNWVLSFIIIILVFSAFIGNIENHFRSGKLNLSSTMGFVNNSILSMIVYAIIFLIGYVVVKFLLGLIIFILHIVFGRLGLEPTMLLYVISVIVSLVVLLFSGYLFSYILIAMPDTNICGYSVATSLSDASDLINKNIFKTLFLVALPFLFVIPFVCLGHIFNFETISSVLCVLILFMYYPVLGYTIYFDYSRLERYDNIKKYYYK